MCKMASYEQVTDVEVKISLMECGACFGHN